MIGLGSKYYTGLGKPGSPVEPKPVLGPGLCVLRLLI